ncbi:MAG TPA: hypothetical protein VKX40_13615 [Aequorivita sp.]|nr:hypothetical protein [Aequorivita sp.]
MNTSKIHSFSFSKKGRFFSLNLLLFFSVFCGLFMGCEKEDFSGDEYLAINGFLNLEVAIDQPEVYNDIESLRVLKEANLRAYKHVRITKEGFIELTVTSGSQLNMCENLFAFVANNVKQANSYIAEGKVEPAIENGVLRLRSRLKQNRIGVPRLKNGSENDGPSLFNPNGRSGSAVLGFLDGLLESEPEGLLNDYIDIENSNWTNSGGYSYIRGYGTLNGQKAQFQISNPCFGWEDPLDCDANQIGQVVQRTYTLGSVAEQYTMLNTYGDPIITINIYR